MGLGAFIGYERRAPDRPAGVRTMSIVCVGACLFTIAGTYAFVDGPQEWDMSRISAAIPSGVGFLGGAVIWKGTRATGEHMVTGLSTGLSIWGSAAVGVLCGGRMYFQAAFGTAIVFLPLKYGPSVYGVKDGVGGESDSSDSEDECWLCKDKDNDDAIPAPGLRADPVDSASLLDVADGHQDDHVPREGSPVQRATPRQKRQP